MRALLLLAVAACTAAPPAEPVSPIPGLPGHRVSAPAPAQRVATSSTVLPPGAVSVTDVVTFNADGRVVGVCLVVGLASGARLYLPFADTALWRPSQPVLCGGG